MLDTAQNRPELPAEIARRRTFAIISHPDAGKTTLTEKFLLYGGAIQMAGQVRAKGEARRTRSDFMKMEQDRGISVSASAMSFDFDGFRFNLVVSAGQEISTTLDQYMDFALEQPSTRVLAIFMEAIRNPAGFVQVLEKAQQKGIPVVVTKVGRTEASAKLAATHSGAIAGDNTAYEALFKKYGVICTESLDDLLTTSLLLSEGQGIDKGGLGYISDSGGLRELFVDIADKHQVPFAQISDATTQKLRDRLPLGLDPVNPQTTARMCSAFQTWKRYDADRQALIAAQLDRILAQPGLSRDTTEMISRIRAG